ncbi:hypothetical protein F5890DRAFT_1473052 [Lentinula detonsa]|uniref:Uncharacterized protein n=1 Tax=Lentinula detonsa TaxID=2804962 RepID=A0AA38UTL9_9AGAR|nr:hypothetical protein F5890DRAFT_1473052 [Lentinula detonsa]
MSSYQNIAVNVPIEVISPSSSSFLCSFIQFGLFHVRCITDQSLSSSGISEPEVVVDKRHLTTLRCLHIYPEDQLQGFNATWSSWASVGSCQQLKFQSSLTGVDGLANFSGKNPSWSISVFPSSTLAFFFSPKTPATGIIVRNGTIQNLLDTKVFSGEKRQFEAWFWNTPEGTLSPLESQPFVRVVDVPEMRSFPCFYPGCPKQAEPYRTKQNRDKFKNKGSVKRHRDRFGH